MNPTGAVAGGLIVAGLLFYRSLAFDGRAEPESDPDHRLLAGLARGGFDPAQLSCDGGWSR